MATTTIAYTTKEVSAQKVASQPRWQRITLLSIIGYEAAGCLTGGSLLVAAPDGRLMDMPVAIMHGAFADFLIPGIILFGLGILCTAAFIAVIRRTPYDWFMVCLSLCGLYIWFVVEIIILQELHWLHAMWGIPVLLGLTMAIPLIALRHETVALRKALLSCGVLSSLWYLVINIVVPMQYDGYSSVTQTVSELSATGAPTRIAWVLLATLYPLLYNAFGWGVLQTAGKNRYLRLAGALIIVYGILNFYWPPMHTREVIAAGGGTISDTLHIAWAMITLATNMLLLGLGAAALGKAFRLYSIATFAVFIVFGILIFTETPGIEANLPTPGIGVWERINIGAYMLWVVVLAIALLRNGHNGKVNQRLKSFH